MQVSNSLKKNVFDHFFYTLAEKISFLFVIIIHNGILSLSFVLQDWA